MSKIFCVISAILFFYISSVQAQAKLVKNCIDLSGEYILEKDYQLKAEEELYVAGIRITQVDSCETLKIEYIDFRNDIKEWSVNTFLANNEAHEQSSYIYENKLTNFQSSPRSVATERSNSFHRARYGFDRFEIRYFGCLNRHQNPGSFCDHRRHILYWFDRGKLQFARATTIEMKNHTMNNFEKYQFIKKDWDEILRLGRDSIRAEN